MRKIFYLLLLLSTSFFYGQTSGISYQAVIYNPNGQNIPGVNIQNSPMVNRPVCLRFNLIDNLSQLEYQEVIQTTTDEFGMVNLIIGSGNQTGGYSSSFNSVVWNSNTKSLKVEFSTNGDCQQFVILSNNPLSTVPFAYAAVTADNVSGVVAIQNGGTGATNITDAKINLILNNVDNTSDLNKPISTATQAALDTKENTIAAGTTAQYYRGDKTWQTLDKTTVGLANVDNTSDANKPISTATQAVLNTKENTANKSISVPLDGTSNIKFPSVKAVKDYVDGAIAIATIPDATTAIKGKIQLAGDLGGTAAVPTVPGLANKENTANKSTTTTLGTSDVLFPSQNAVKTYVDTNITTVNNANSALQVTVNANATAASNAIAAVQADVNQNEITSNAADVALQNNITTLQNTVTTNAANTSTALALKENTANKSTTTTLGTSDVLFPSQNAVKTYVDTQIASATIPDATTTLKGKIQLAGDLGGTAAVPTVPGLANKENTANKSTTTTLGTSDVLFPSQNAVKTYVDTNITTVNTATSALQATVNANATAASNATALVQADVDANETAANTAINLKENTANKSTTTTLGTSDVLFPSQNAVKTYVDTNITTVNTATSALQATVNANATAASNATALVQADVDANETAANTAINLKENTANKSTTTTLGTSDVLFPSQNAVKTYVDTNITTVNTATSALQATVNANATAASNATALVQADVDANETAANTAINLKENTANKSTTTTLGTSDVLFPSQNAVKTYVDTNITTVNTATSALQATVNANATAASNATALVQADVDANETAANTAINLKENLTNKSTTTTLGTSDDLYPTQNAVKTYVDAQIATATIVDADATTKGKIQLAGDLGGTAAAPTVPGLANKEDLVNKSLDVSTDGTSDEKYPSVKAVKDYVDSSISSGTIPDATNSLKGKIQLAGDLTGTAASPTVANGAITTSKLADNAVETIKIKNANVTNAKLDKANIPLSGFGAAAADVDLGSNKLTNVTDPTTAQDAATKNYVDTTTSSITTLADGKIYLGNASNVATEVAPTGDVTITNAGVTAIGASKVVTTMIADDAVETIKIKNANVTTAKIANTSVTNAKLDKANIPLSGFGAAAADVDLGSNKLTNVTDPTTAQDAATKNYVDTTTSSITTLADGKIYLGNASNVATEVAPTGDVTITNAGVTAIGASKVVTTMIADDAVETIKIKNANVTTAKIANTSVTNAKLDKANIPLSGFGAAAADVDFGSNKLTNVTDPTAAQDAATKNYVDTTTSAITTLADGKIYLGNASNVATEVAPTGDVTITNAGVTAIGASKVVTTMIADDAVETIKIKDANVTYAKIQNVSTTNKVLGRVSTGAGVIEEIPTTGSGNVVRATSPTLVTPNLGTPSAVVLTSATGLPLTSGVTGILPIANGGTASATKNFVDLTTDQTIAGVKTFSGTSTVVQQNLTVNSAGTTGQGIILSDDGDIVDNNDGAATFRFGAGIKINNGNGSLGTTTKITLANTGNITATGTVESVGFKLSGGAPAVGKVLTSDANGLGSWTSLPASNLATGVTGTLPIANGGTGSTTQNFVDLTTDQTVAGVKTFSSDIVVNGVKIGRGTGDNGQNTALGNSALGTGTGTRNTGIGYNALGNYTGSSFDNNTAVGYSNSNSITTGQQNTALGAEALMAVTTANSNTAIGAQTLLGATGSGNTALGYAAGQIITSGTNNTFLGNGANAGLATATNATAIGNGATVAGSNTIQLGNTSVTSVNTSGAITSASGITGTQLTSTVAIGTAPLVVTSTTPVANLSIGGNAATVTTNANLTGDVTSVGNATTVGKINGTALSGLATGILKNTTSTGVPSIAVAADFPTLNQNTTGTAANVTGTVAIANGGTGATTAAAALANLVGNPSPNTVLAGLAAGVNTIVNSDGSALTGWSNTSNLPVLDNTISAASFKFGPSNNWDMERDLGQSLMGKSYQFDIYFTANSNNAFLFGHNSSGSNGRGIYLSQVGTSNGFISGTNSFLYTNKDGADTNTFSANTWYTIKVSLATGTNASSYSINGVLKSTFTWTDSGNTWFGFVSDGGISYIDNINVTSVNTGSPSFRSLVAADIPTLNQNTTGTAANVTGTVAIANGGTGSTTKNFVDLTTTQTIAGTKTFSSTIAGSITGNAATVTTNANLTGPITSSGNATSIASQTGTGTKFVMDTSPTLVTPVIGAATGTSLSVSGQLTSTVAIGTAPLVVTSTTPVANLNIGGNAATATTSTNIAGGAAGSLPYQTAAATTAMLAKGADGQILTLVSGSPSWSNAAGSTVVTSSTTYAITLADAYVFYTGTAAGALTIPAAASTNAGKAIIIKNKTAFSITITPATTGNIYIDSANTAVNTVTIGIEASNNWIKLISDGTQWNVLRALF